MLSLNYRFKHPVRRVTPTSLSPREWTPYELGVKFTSSVPGWVAGVRFYKGSGNGGTHTGSLWSSSGTLLAKGTFTNETASGWQTMLFPDPVQISANTTYVGSYYDPDGHYSVRRGAFRLTVEHPAAGGQSQLHAGRRRERCFQPGRPRGAYSLGVLRTRSRKPANAV